jgi:L-fuculose-phosphate aldolase
MKRLPRSLQAESEALCRYSLLLWERGWVANHDGNVSVRISDDRFLATPTGESKRLITPEMLVLVDPSGKVHAGSRRIFSEWNLHAAAYGRRPDVQAVVHAHPPNATAAGLTGLDLREPMLPEAVVSLGAIPTAKNALPGEAAAAAVGAEVVVHDAMLLPGNGALSVGDDLEQAYLRMELVEHLAQITALAQKMGTPVGIEASARAALLKKRAAAGLGSEGRAKASGEGAVAGGDRETLARVVRARAESLTGDARVAGLVTDEVLRLLGRS